MQAASHVRHRAVEHAGLSEPYAATTLQPGLPEQQSRVPVPLTFHPAYCYRASPTWFTWAKLTAYDVHHRLRAHAAYRVSSATGAPGLNLDLAVDTGTTTIRTGPADTRTDNTPLLFYLNHPIQFVQLIGVVVAVEEYFEKHWLFTIDDSSGETIEIYCRKPVKQTPTDTGTMASVQSRSAGTVTQYRGGQKATEGESEIARQASDHNHFEHHVRSDDESNLKPNTHEVSESGTSPEERSRIEIVGKLSIGTVVQVKGRISTFRRTRQLQLERITVVQDTNHEVRLMSARTDFMRQILSRPWHLTAAQQGTLFKAAQDDRDSTYERAAKSRRREKEKVLREERHHQRILRRYQIEEEKRAAEAWEAQRAGEVLKKQAS